MDSIKRSLASFVDEIGLRSLEVSANTFGCLHFHMVSVQKTCRWTLKIVALQLVSHSDEDIGLFMNRTGIYLGCESLVTKLCAIL